MAVGGDSVAVSSHCTSAECSKNYPYLDDVALTS